MELRELRSFVMAADLRSISRAAERLGLGQPTVTSHIQRLERELGMVLFDRVRRPIQLTLSGKTLVELAEPLVRGIDSLAASTAEAEQHGPVEIGSTPDIIPHTLLRVVRVFVARYPHVRLRIRSGTRAEVIRMVQEGEVDLAVAPPPERDAGLHFEGLFVFERVLITPLLHPLLSEPLRTLDQIAQSPLILMAEGTHTRNVLEEGFRRRGVSYEVIVELDSMDMIKRYVALGMGVSIGPRLAIEPEDEAQLGIVSMANLLPVEQAGVTTLPGKALSGPAQNLISVMRDVMAPAGSRR